MLKTITGFGRVWFFENLANSNFISTVDQGDLRTEKIINGVQLANELLNNIFKTDEIIALKVQHGSEISYDNHQTKNRLVKLVDGIIYKHYKFGKHGKKIIAGTTADCPYLMIQAENKNFSLAAIVHCGWRGIADNIVTKTINQIFNDNFEPNDIKIGLWSGICIDCFEVGADVKTAMNQYESFFMPNSNGKWQVSLAQIIKHKLAFLGLLGHQVEESGICPKCARDNAGNKIFYSYRGGDIIARNGLFISI